MKSHLSKLLLLLAVVVPSMLGPLRAHAVDGIGLSPAISEVTLEEGQDSVSFTVGISNSTDQTADLRISTLDFGALDESGGIAFLGQTGQETVAYGLSQWMQLEKDRLTLEPGETQEVRVVVDNRESLGPGGHYGAVVVSDAGLDSRPDSLSVVPAASTLVLLKKAGGAVEELNLELVIANKSIIKLPSDITLRFQNTGNVHVVPRGTVELFSPAGPLVYRGVINQSSSFVLPESYRRFTLTFDQVGQPWLPGRYRLVTTWRYDGREEPMVVEQHVWYAGKLLLWTAGMLCLAIVLILFVRWRNKPRFRGQ